MKKYLIWLIILLPAIAFADILILKDGTKIDSNYIYKKDYKTTGYFKDGNTQLISNELIDWEATEAARYERDKNNLPHEYESNRRKTQPNSTNNKSSKGAFYSPPRTSTENPISLIPRSKAKNDLKKHLLKRYENSYSTVEMLLNNGMDAYDNLCTEPSNQVNDAILNNLLNRYYPSFSTIKMLFDSNKESYERLNR